MKCKECNSEALRHSQLCAYCLVMRDNIIRRPRFALKVLMECCPEFQRLEAIASKIKKYDHYSIQAANLSDHPLHYLYWKKSMKKALDDAITLSRGIQ